MQVSKIDTFSGHRDCVYTLAQGAQPNIFYSSGADGQVVAWDLAKPDLGTLLAQIPASVYAMAYFEAENALIVGQNGEGIQKIALAQNIGSVSLKFTYNNIFDIKILGNLAFAATGDGILVIIDLPKMAVLQTIKVTDKSIRSIAIHPTANEIALATSDQNCYRICLSTYALLQKIEGHSNSVFCIKYNNTGQYLYTAGRDAQLKIWQKTTDNYLLHSNIAAHMYAINDLAFSPDTSLLATCSMDKAIKIWDANSLKLLKVVDKARHAGHGTSVNKLLWSSYHNSLLSASDDRHIALWQLKFE
jgi:WD40 repeat protein